MFWMNTWWKGLWHPQTVLSLAPDREHRWAVAWGWHPGIHSHFFVHSTLKKFQRLRLLWFGCVLLLFFILFLFSILLGFTPGIFIKGILQWSASLLMNTVTKFSIRCSSRSIKFARALWDSGFEKVKMKMKLWGSFYYGQRKNPFDISIYSLSLLLVCSLVTVQIRLSPGRFRFRIHLKKHTGKISCHSLLD